MPSYRQDLAAGSRPSAGSGVSPTTATVLDFICLFTHDLKRKQKRWQDGKLKYHTFNKRVMVYDDRGNFVGDAHWSGDGDLGDGEELELDRGSAIVQVAECTGSREQDLTELLDKRAREVEKRRQIAAQQPRRAPTLSRVPEAQRPLSAAVPSPARIGRAHIPQHSPFEARKAQAAEQEGEAPPPSKRRKRSESPPSKMGHARALFGTTLSLSSRPMSSLSKVLRDRTNVGPLLQTRPEVVKETVSEKDGDDGDESMAEEEPVRTRRGEPPVGVVMPPPADLSRPLPKPRLSVTRVVPRSLKVPAPKKDVDGDEVMVREEPTTARRRETSVELVVPPPADSSLPLPKSRLSAKGVRPHHPKMPIQPIVPHVGLPVNDSHIEAPEEDMCENSGLSALQARSQQKRKPERIEVLEEDMSEDAGPSGPPIRSEKRKKKKEGKKPLHTEALEEETSEGAGPSAQAARSGKKKRKLADKKTTEEDMGEDAGPLAQSPRPEKKKKGLASRKKAEDTDQVQVPKPAKPAKLAKQATKISRKTRAASETAEPEEDDRRQATKPDAPTKGNDLPRTELRIRSRKRRGLLMVSEKAQAISEHRSPSAPGGAEGRSNLQHKKRPLPTSAEESGSGHGADAPSLLSKPKTNSEEEESIVVDTPPSRYADTREPTVVEAGRDISESPTPPRPTRRLQSRKESTTATEDDGEKVAESSSEGDVHVSKRREPVVTRKQSDSASARTIPGIDKDSESEDDWEGPRRPTTKRKAKPKLAPETQLTGKEADPGPRISRMGRKSVKSKEIFGFKPPNSDQLVPNTFASALGRIGAAAITPACGPGPAFAPVTRVEPRRPTTQVEEVKEPDGQLDAEPTTVTDKGKSHNSISSEAGPRRIANPASRGRKAATKADAAGQAPRVLVPFDTTPAPAAPVRAQRPAPVRQLGAASKPALPGFAKANGGAWSRHAYDLLGMSRPGG